MITTINSSTAAANANWPVETLAVIPIVLFLLLILQRGLIAGMRGPRVKWIEQAITVAAVPLLLILFTTATVRILALVSR